MAEPWRERVEIGPCVLYLADCLEMLAAGAIPADGAIVTDPPYGIGYQHGGGGMSGWAFAKARSGAASRIIGDDRVYDPTPWLDYARGQAKRRGNAKVEMPLSIALCGADNYASRIPDRVGCYLAWDKACGGGPADSFTDLELVWIGTRNARRIYRHRWKGRMRAGDANPRLHVSQKPVGLMRWLMETARVPIERLIIDPYMGSGTTGVACLQTGRRFLGIEIAEEHYRVAVDRITRAWQEIST